MSRRRPYKCNRRVIKLVSLQRPSSSRRLRSQWRCLVLVVPSKWSLGGCYVVWIGSGLSGAGSPKRRMGFGGPVHVIVHEGACFVGSWCHASMTYCGLVGTVPRSSAVSQDQEKQCGPSLKDHRKDPARKRHHPMVLNELALVLVYNWEVPPSKNQPKPPT